MTVITTDTVKSLLGITVTTYDDAIDAKIPIMDSLVKRLTKNRYSYQIIGGITTGSKTLSISKIYSYAGIVFDPCSTFMTLSEVLTNGQMLEGTGIASGSFITDINAFGYLTVPSVTMSANATATGSVTAMTGIPIDLQHVIAKGIWYMIDNDSTVIKDDTWTSRSMGPLSITRGNSDLNKIDGASGMPMWFVRALPSFHGGY